jgi:ribosomal protein L16 Arg81 hydroxylase
MKLADIFPKHVDFKVTHWPERSLVHHGPLARLGRVATARPFSSADAFLSTAARARIPLWVERNGEPSRQQLVPPDAEDLFEKGAIYTCFGAERLVPSLGQLLRTLERELDLPNVTLTCHAYLSAKGARVRPHFDRQENLGLHLWGNKRWWIAENETIAFPHENQALGEPTNPALRRITRGKRWPTRMPSPRSIPMRPGTAIFLPRGLWHATVTRTTSLSLTVLFLVPSWADVLGERLRARLLLDASFRRPAVGPARPAEDAFVSAARAVAAAEARATRAAARRFR